MQEVLGSLARAGHAVLTAAYRKYLDLDISSVSAGREMRVDSCETCPARPAPT